MLQVNLFLKSAINATRNLNKLKRCVSTNVTFKEVSIKVPWGHIAGKWWGPTDSRPVLSLHGWQNNCGTYDTLIPHLNKNIGFLCIDFPGHGYSSRLPQGMFYYTTNYIILVHYIAKYFEWPKVSLMGHSLGAYIAYLYNMVYPQNIDFVVCLDTGKPWIQNNLNVVMGNSIERFLNYVKFIETGSEPPSYTIDEIKEKVSEPDDYSIMLEHTHFMMERNVAPSKQFPGKYYFTLDPRLKSLGFLNFSQNELIEYAQYMTPPIFIIKATTAPYYEPKETFYKVLEVLRKSSVDCDFHYIEGSHHVHLNNPERVAPLLNQFIQRHNTEDRKVGGIKDEIINTGRTGRESVVEY